MKILKVLSILTLASSFQVLHAQSLDGSTQRPESRTMLGGESSNTFVFGHVAHSKWVLPFFFEPELKCGEASLASPTIPCRLIIWNRPNKHQSEFLESLVQDKSNKTYFVSEFSPFVSNIRAHYEPYSASEYLPRGNIPPVNQGMTVSDSHEFQTFFLRVPKDDIEVAQGIFEFGSLGEYSISFDLKSLHFPEYLRADLSQSSMNDLKKAIGTNMSYEEKSDLMTRIFQHARLVSNHLSWTEADTIAKLFVKKLAFDWNGQFLKQSIQGNSVFLINEATKFDLKCTASINLSSYSKTNFQCSRASE